jgi:hypothetical protein
MVAGRFPRKAENFRGKAENGPRTEPRGCSRRHPAGDSWMRICCGEDADRHVCWVLKIDFPRFDRPFSKALFSEPSFQGVNFGEVREISREFESCLDAEATILGFLARGVRTMMQIRVDFLETLGSRLYKTRGTIHEPASNTIFGDTRSGK